ncbi:MAG: biopolymer transporter ExbD [Rickettsiales bacterium]
MIHFERRRRSVQGLNLTSLVDVILMLVIFFMLTTSFVRIQYMDLSLPGNGAPPPKAAKNVTTFLDIANNGEVRLDGKPVPLVQLEENLRTLFKQKPNQKILVKCGDMVSVQRLVTIMDTIDIAGGKSVAVDHLIEARDVTPITVSPDGTEYSPQNEVDEFLAP